MDYTVHGILQPRILKWVAFLFSRESPDPGIELGSPAWQVDCLPTELAGCWWEGLKYFDSTQNVTWIHKVSKCCSKTELIDVLNAKLSQPSIKKKKTVSLKFNKDKVLVAQLCVTLCNPMDCSPQGFSVHGVLQARILEWVAMPCSRGFSQPRNWTYISPISWIGRPVLYH